MFGRTARQHFIDKEMVPGFWFLKSRFVVPNLGFFNFHLGIHSLNKYLPNTYNVYGKEIKAVNKA